MYFCTKFPLKFYLKKKKEPTEKATKNSKAMEPTKKATKNSKAMTCTIA